MSQSLPNDRLLPIPGLYENTNQAFRDKLIQVAHNVGMNPNHLAAVISFETGESFSPNIRNGAGSGATGLIQFIPDTAHGLGTSTNALAQMSAIDQLDYVQKYLEPYAGKMNTVEDAYMAVFTPRGMGKSADYVMYSQGSAGYRQNRGLDVNGNGQITVGEAASKVREKLDAGLRQAGAQGPASNLRDVNFQTQSLLGGSTAQTPVELEILQPTEGRITSRFGPRTHPTTGEPGRMHSGLDYGAPRGTSVVASLPGTVSKVVSGCSEGQGSCGGGFGNYIVVDHGDGKETLYAHLQDIGVTEGQVVGHGEEIGTVGNTGRSSGPHLHFELKIDGEKVDPEQYVGQTVPMAGVPSPSNVSNTLKPYEFPSKPCTCMALNASPHSNSLKSYLFADTAQSLLDMTGQPTGPGARITQQGEYTIREEAGQLSVTAGERGEIFRTAQGQVVTNAVEDHDVSLFTQGVYGLGSGRNLPVTEASDPTLTAMALANVVSTVVRLDSRTQQTQDGTSVLEGYSYNIMANGNNLSMQDKEGNTILEIRDGEILENYATARDVEILSKTAQDHRQGITHQSQAQSPQVSEADAWFAAQVVQDVTSMLGSPQSDGRYVYEGQRFRTHVYPGGPDQPGRVVLESPQDGRGTILDATSGQALSVNHLTTEDMSIIHDSHRVLQEAAGYESQAPTPELEMAG